MNGKILQGYIIVIVSALAILAAALLLIVQGATKAEFSVYFKEAVSINVGVLMLLSAVGGIILVQVIKLLFFGMTMLHRGRQEYMRKLGQRPIEVDDHGSPGSTI